jgi:hypothetical protein
MHAQVGSTKSAQRSSTHAREPWGSFHALDAGLGCGEHNDDKFSETCSETDHPGSAEAD